MSKKENSVRIGIDIGGTFTDFMVVNLVLGTAHYFSKQRPEKIPKTVLPVTPIEKVEPTAKSDFLFCPECGAKIEDPNLKFCGNCGHEL